MAEFKSPKEKVDFILAAHARTLLSVDHNVKAIFTSFLWIHAAPDTIKVEVPVHGSPTKAVALVTPAEALTQGQNTVRDVATQIRQITGNGRASGGGRPKQTTVTLEQAKAAGATTPTANPAVKPEPSAAAPTAR